MAKQADRATRQMAGNPAADRRGGLDVTKRAGLSSERRRLDIDLVGEALSSATAHSTRSSGPRLPPWAGGMEGQREPILAISRSAGRLCICTCRELRPE